MSTLRATHAAGPRPEVGPTEAAQLLGCPQHRPATTMTRWGVVIADGSGRGVVGALRKPSENGVRLGEDAAIRRGHRHWRSRGSLPIVISDCTRGLRDADRMAVVSGWAFARACCSVIPLCMIERRLSLVRRHASAASKITSTPAASNPAGSATATLFPVLQASTDPHQISDAVWAHYEPPSVVRR